MIVQTTHHIADRKRMVVLDKMLPNTGPCHRFFLTAFEEKAPGIAEQLGSRRSTPGSAVSVTFIVELIAGIRFQNTFSRSSCCKYKP